MRRAAFEITGLVLLLAAVVFFYFSVRMLTDGDHLAGILQIFVGFSLIRAGLELTKLSLLERGDRQ